MSKWAKFYDTLASGRSDRNTDYQELVSYLERLGWQTSSRGGSHRIYSHPLVLTSLNLQPEKSGKAKWYQVTQVQEKTKMDGYEVNLYYSPEDGYYVAGIVEFIGCVTDGPTAEEALANLREVKVAWIDAMRRQGHPIPSPRYNLSLTKADGKTPVAA